MKLLFTSLFNAVLAVTILCRAAQATTYSAVNDFSLAGNPTGPWSYLYQGTKLSTPTVGSGGLTGVDYWWDSMNVPTSTLIGKNVTASTITYLNDINIPTNYLIMDPEANTSVDLRFTSPSTGNYLVTGGFLGIDGHENSHPVQITDNNVVIFSGTINNYGQSDTFNLTESLHAGDVLNFEALTGSTYTYLSTGLAATITTASTATPEPASLLLFAAGLISIYTLKSRRKNNPN